MDDFAALLLAARRKSGLTQAQVATAAGLTPSYLSFIENRKKPPPSDEVCRRLADALALPAERLIEVAHLERAPDTVRKRVHRLSHTLRRERRSRRRVLESLLSPFLFRGPPGYLESALDTIGISPKRRHRLRDALRAVGRQRQDVAAEVARIVEELPERDRNLLLNALPRLLSDQAAAAPDRETADAPTTARRAAQADAGSPPPLYYVAPEPGAVPATPYLLEVSEPMARAAAPGAGVRDGDRLVVDPQLAPEAGDLVVGWTPDGGRVRFHRPDAPPGGPEDPSAPVVGTVIEVRRRLRRPDRG